MSHAVRMASPGSQPPSSAVAAFVPHCSGFGGAARRRCYLSAASRCSRRCGHAGTTPTRRGRGASVIMRNDGQSYDDENSSDDDEAFNSDAAAAAAAAYSPTASAEDDLGEELESGPEMGRVRAPRPTRYGRRRANVRRRRRQGQAHSDALPKAELRITGGDAKGRKLASPDVYLRPMMGKVREALFSMLFQFDVLEGGRLVDVFCGSGSVGLEALSRGMDDVVFVDAARECVATAMDNLQHCGFEGRGAALCARAEDVLRTPEVYGLTEAAALIALTPPYEEVDYGVLMHTVATSPLVGEGTHVVVEYPVELGSLAPAYAHRLVGLRNRRYGRTVLALYACQPDADIDPRPDEFIRPV